MHRLPGIRYHFSGLLILLLFNCLFLPGLVLSQTESEPNDQQDQAIEIRLGERVSGYFQKSADYDWYKLVIDNPGKNVIRIELSGVPDVDVRLEVADESGTQLKYSNFTGKGKPESIINLGVVEGNYYIAAFGYEENQNEKYTLSTQLIGPLEKGQEFEPNDSMYKANEIRLGEIIQGLFQAKNEPDWYKLVIDKPGKNIIRVDLSGVPGINSFLFFHDSQGYQIKRGDTGRNQGEPEAFLNLGVTQGVYYISTWAYEENKTEAYSLSTELVGPWEEGMEFENNDERRYANEIKPDMKIEGHIQPRDDQDYYSITVPEPGMDLFVIEMSSPLEADLELALFDAEGNQIKSPVTGKPCIFMTTEGLTVAGVLAVKVVMGL